MPTLKAIHMCNSHQPTLQPKIAKEYVFANADRRPKKKYDRTITMAIRNAGESIHMKITLNKLIAKRKVKCTLITHYA